MATNEQLESWVETMEWMRKNKAQLDGAGLYLLYLYEQELAKLDETEPKVPEQKPEQKGEININLVCHLHIIASPGLPACW
jgi:hypothetical protein